MIGLLIEIINKKVRQLDDKITTPNKRIVFVQVCSFAVGK